MKSKEGRIYFSLIDTIEEQKSTKQYPGLINYIYSISFPLQDKAISEANSASREEKIIDENAILKQDEVNL